MFKLFALFALIAVTCAAPQVFYNSAPLLARIHPQPEAPASTAHAAHVAAIAAPIAYAHPSYIAAAPLAYHLPSYQIAYSAAPIEQHGYKIAY